MNIFIFGCVLTLELRIIIIILLTDQPKIIFSINIQQKIKLPSPKQDKNTVNSLHTKKSYY